MKIKLNYLDKYNFVLYQNDCSLIKEIKVSNDSELRLSNIVIEISCEPEFMYTITTNIDLIEANSSYIIDFIDSKFNFDYLDKLNERIKGNIKVKVSNDDDYSLTEYYEIVLLPKHEWPGVYPIPELIAAYIEPNNSQVNRVLYKVSEKLKKETENSSLDGYQSKSKERVWEICAAIYNSLCEFNINYCNPPASFEDSGQKIRTPDAIIETRLATCIDISLLMSSCLEQVGLGTVIFFLKGHSFIGVWLEENFVEDITSTNLSFFNKCYKTNDMIPIETTLITNNTLVSFDKAVEYAEKYLLEENNFIIAVDVVAAREVSKIRPLNSIKKEVEVLPLCSDRDKSILTIPPKEFIDYNEKNNKSKNRLDIWKSKLLDLSLRNNLINFKETKQTIKILCTNPAELEDELNNDKSYKIDELPILEISKVIESKVYESRTKAKFIEDVIKADIKRLILHTPYTENETNIRLTNLFRKQKVSEEESGSNTLYLSIGLLQWKESEHSKVLLKSPILLVPVDLKRKSIIDGYRLVLRDDEPIINFTLLEKLNSDFGINISGLDPLPEDDSGVNVPKVWYLFRQEIKKLTDWDVIEEVWLGHFSFKKYLMWKDLQNNANALSGNSLVKKILQVGNDENLINIDAVVEEEVDKVKSSDLVLPLSADSSQIAAILSVQKGKNLIIQGPPGTGKSQTITNLIANSLSIGKSVLFVSEKKVALEVVYNRLKEINLDSFCLELHSNKSQKKEVIQSFKRSLDYNLVEEDNKWDEISNKLDEQKNYLNNYVKEIHKPNDIGYSIYDSYSISFQYKDAEKLNLNIQNGSISKEEYNSILDNLRLIAGYCKEINVQNGYVFKECRINNFDFKLISELEKKIKLIFDSFDKLVDIYSSLKPKLDLNISKEVSFSHLEIANSFLNVLHDVPNIPSSFLDIVQWPLIVNDLNELIELKKSHENISFRLYKICVPEFLDIDLVSLKNELISIKSFWLLKKFLKTKFILKKHKQMFLSKNITYYELLKATELGVQLKEYNNKIDEYNVTAMKILGHRWRTLTSTDLDNIVTKSIEIRSETDKLSNSIDSKKIKIQMKDMFDNGDLVNISNSICQAINEFSSNFNNLASCIIWIESKLMFEFNKKLSFKDVFKMLQLYEANKKDLRFWTAIQQKSLIIREKGLHPILDALFEMKFDPSKLLDVFKFNFHNKWLENYLNNSTLLKNFSSTNHNSIISEYKYLDLQHQDESIIRMIERIIQKKPVNNKLIASSSPIAVINKESLKKRKQKSIRNFLDTIQSVMNELKPCMMMSPLSVAQYLPPKQIFDIVIFDEASQITPWDAIGAIGRGKQVVVVGDSKQLPPTNLFTKTINDDNYDEDYEDLESILDECKKYLDDVTLKWHYRSKYESLIAFSNRYIYDNKLYTFPNASIDDKAVSFKFVSDGIYDRGRSRTNKKEAQAIVRDIISYLENDIVSIGVITFNQSQCNLIEDLLFNEIKKHPILDQKISSTNDDTILIKNIENVQGDERDIILFSMTFGFDDKKVLTQRFSSLNSIGGHRRLNVAITRARQKIIVFSSIKYEHIDIKKAKFEGVKLLRKFLEYAEKGSAEMIKNDITLNNDHIFDSPFEKEVFTALEDKGWQLMTQIGVGEYRIDLGVIHPKKPGVFLAGIECDGKSYHSSKSARDRDILRQSVLESKGWTILRIWSTDWFYDNEHAIQRIDNELKKTLSQQQQNLVRSEKQNQFKKVIPVEYTTSNQSTIDFDTYEETELEYVYEPESFYKVENKYIIIDQIRKVLKKEAPILKEKLYSLIYKSWGLSRGGSKVNKILDNCSTQFIKTTMNDRTFFWENDKSMNNLVRLRTFDDNPRNPSEIAPQELAFGLKIIIDYNLSISKEELYKKMHETLGWKKNSKLSVMFYDEALEFLQTVYELKIENENIIIN